jgi:hypothetical protein
MKPAKTPDAPVEGGQDAPAPEPVREVPTYLKSGKTAEAQDLRVIEAESGREIKHVIEANAAEGWLVRFDVKGGNYVREGDDLKTIREEMPIRFEWAKGA